MVIFKLGGSLLTLADLASRLGKVLAQRNGGRCALVVGGGAAADLVREWDHAHQLGDEAAHQLALHAMRLTAEFVAALLPDARIVEDRQSLLSAWSSGRLPLLEADLWLNTAERRLSLSPASRLEDTWDSVGGEGRGEGPPQCDDGIPSSGLRPPSLRSQVDAQSKNQCGEKGEIHAGFTVPHTWDATSDTIAAWFATELNAAELVLLKSVERPSGDPCDAARAGHVDRCFPDAAAHIPQLSWVNLRSADCRVEPWCALSKC